MEVIHKVVLREIGKTINIVILKKKNVYFKTRDYDELKNTPTVRHMYLSVTYFDNIILNVLLTLRYFSVGLSMFKRLLFFICIFLDNGTAECIKRFITRSLLYSGVCVYLIHR